MTYKMIAEDTGLKESWFDILVNKPEIEPGARKVQRLIEYLTGKPLLTTGEG